MVEKMIFLDLDGVVFDFDTAVQKFHPGNTRDSVKQKDFWAPLAATPNFFRTLDLFKDAYDMYWMLKYEGWKIEILTALPLPTGHFVTAAEDKIAHVREHLDRHVMVHTVVGGKNKYKWLEQKPGSILVDDYKRNINMWNEYGGIGILHEPGNSEKTYKRLQEIMK